MGIFGNKESQVDQNQQSDSQTNQSSDQSQVGGSQEKIQQTQGQTQAPMPSENQGYTKEIDGKKYHFSGAEQTHVVPEVTAEELDQKTKQDPNQVKEEQKANLSGSPENK